MGKEKKVVNNKQTKSADEKGKPEDDTGPVVA